MAEETRPTVAINELPIDELIQYGRNLGLRLDAKMGHGELLRLVRQRQELLLELDRQALLDIVVWARRPVRQSANKESLAREIAGIRKMHFADLSHRGLLAYARLRGVPVFPEEPRAEIEARIQAHETWLDRVQRKRRKIMGALIGKMFDGADGESDEEYRFLPESPSAPSLQEHITEEGVVGGIARKLRGAADGYLQEKMDEIERRIDRKLDEIDRRLAEWRDREIANRLKIIKITVAATILVALLSLGYKYLLPR